MRRWAWFCLLGVCLLSACNPRLERPGIPVYAGIRVAEDAEAKTIRASFDELKARGISHVLIELPLRADTSGLFLPEVPPEVSDLLRAELPGLKDRGLSWSLALTPENRESLFPIADAPAPGTWVKHLAGSLDSLLLICDPRPVRIVLGPSLEGVGYEGKLWAELPGLMRHKGEVMLSYCVNSEWLDELPLALHSFDEIAVSYAQPVDLNFKRHCRHINYALGQVADSLQKPIFISQANLISDDKLLQFKNRLRFWRESVEVRGIVLNTLYEYTVFQDSSSYFGIRADEELMDYLEEYRAD